MKPIIKLPPKDWMIVIAVFLGVYLLLNIILPKIYTGLLAAYLIRPLVWLLLAYYIYRLPKYKGIIKKRFKNLLVKIAVGIAVFQIYLSLIAGLFDKFGKNPNSFTFIWILINIFFVLSALLGMELSRAWLINRLVNIRKPSTLVPFFVAFLYTCTCIPLNQLSKLTGSLEGATKFLGSDFIPQFMEHLMASFLALWGGPLPALAYRGIIQTFVWFSPVLPDLNWAMKAFSGTVVPIIGIAAGQHILKLTPARGNKDSSENLLATTIICIICVLAIWFAVGAFPVRPTIIISGSMRPTIEVGDMAIVGKINPQILKVGDIIQFKTENRSIPTLHRIIEIQKEEDKKTIYITRGDANDVPDDPVQPQQVVGRVIFTVPKVGWATITIREIFS